MIANAENKSGDVAEAVRVLDDAFSGVENVDFLGQASKKFENTRDATDTRNGTYCSMPVKLTFTDRDTRIHFENSLRSLGGPKATQSFPKQVRTVMADCAKALRSAYPEWLVMVRPDTRTLRINGFLKREGEKTWTKLPDSHPIPLGIMIQLPSTSAPPPHATPPILVATGDGSGDGAGHMEQSGQ